MFLHKPSIPVIFFEECHSHSLYFSLYQYQYSMIGGFTQMMSASCFDHLAELGSQCTHKQANRQKSKKANKQKAKKQTSKKANKQTSKQANKQTNKHRIT